MIYPACREVKHLLSGEVRTFDCELIFLDEDFGILRYILEKPYVVNNQILPKNTQTYAFYWESQPFTLYRWFAPQGGHLGDYFNIADRIHLSNLQFEWRDLIVDVFISPQGEISMLDENELPADIDANLARYIDQSTQFIIGNHRKILSELNSLTAKLF